jgi:hypothetical protein
MNNFIFRFRNEKIRFFVYTSPYIVFVTRCITIARIGWVRYIRIRVKVVDHLYSHIIIQSLYYIPLIAVVNPEIRMQQKYSEDYGRNQRRIL